MMYLLISFRVASWAPGQLHDCPNVREETLKDMGKLISTTPQQAQQLVNNVHNYWDVMCVVPCLLFYRCNISHCTYLATIITLPSTCNPHCHWDGDVGFVTKTCPAILGYPQLQMALKTVLKFQLSMSEQWLCLLLGISFHVNIFISHVLHRAMSHIYWWDYFLFISSNQIKSHSLLAQIPRHLFIETQLSSVQDQCD